MSRKRQTKIIGFTAQKGGQGKSACTVNLAAVLSTMRRTKRSKYKYKVLIIDMDCHATATHYLGVYDEQDKGIYDVLTGKTNLDDAIKTVSYKYWSIKSRDFYTSIDIVPSYLYLHTLERKWNEYVNPEIMLSTAIKNSKKIHDYDFVFIDCPPATDCLLTNVYNACDYYILPVFAESQAYINVGITYEQISSLSSNDSVKNVLGCIINNYYETPTSPSYVEAYQNSDYLPCFKTIIPYSKCYDLTLLYNCPVPFFYKKTYMKENIMLRKSIIPLYHSLRNFAKEFLEKISEYE